ISHSRSELDQIDLPPFRAAIAQGIDAIMTAHIVVPALDASGRPATLSKPIMTGLLRKEMGYNGVVITDALDMQGVRKMFGDARVPIEAIKAGVDILLMPPELDVAFNSVLDAVRSGEIGVGRINQSVKRILTLKQRLGLIEDPYVDESQVSAVVGTPANYQAADAITDRTVTLVKNDEDRLPLEPNAYDDVFITGWGVTTTSNLASHISKRGPATSVYETGANPSAAQRQAAVTRSEGSDLIVVTTQRAWSASGQQQLVKDLLATGTPVVVVAVRDPYDIAYFDTAPTYVATYGYKNVSLGSVTEVMFGEVSPTGLLPVDIPRAGDPSQTLYPYGFGLTY
ncbi:MAG: glycoside hydrolase family 3 C-terminal domain-containing protein, partial [Actinomycetota bacterium]|nr:glycoside hydrolase family 3 C-terminal domain-containing protein [Actinomycetota bacterium]